MRTHYEPFVLLAPGVVVLFVAFFVPIGYLCSYSFLVEQIDGTTKLGFGQYLRFFTDSYFWSVSERTSVNNYNHLVSDPGISFGLSYESGFASYSLMAYGFSDLAPHD